MNKTGLLRSWEEWSKKAEKDFTAKLQGKIIAISGKCPECQHQMLFPYAPKIILGLKVKTEILSREERTITISCTCNVKHDTSTTARGCGAAWKMGLEIKENGQIILTASTEPADSNEGDFWYTYNEKLLENLRAVSEKWQVGLASLVTLVTGYSAIKGRESIAKLPAWAQITIGVLILSAVATQIIGAFFALKAAHGSPRMGKHPDSKWTYIFDEATLTLKNLNITKILTFISILIFILAIGFTWYVPEKPISYLQVTYNEKDKICGELVDIQETNLRIKLNSFDDPTKIPLQGIKSMELLTECK
ncbi:MAG: hypothetical protein FJZ86_12650 [Chloroflexi bacterium]|nr:hypothetical protein [Chloroflexota bacterium]